MGCRGCTFVHPGSLYGVYGGLTLKEKDNMSAVTMREMLEAGVHFGHQTRFWNPKMEPYLYGQRNKIHIINLEKTLPFFNDALNFAGKLAAKKQNILFVGTKRAAQKIIQEEATRCGMPYVNRRWLGGLLTNYKTVKQSINRLKDLEAMQLDGSLEKISKKEALLLRREFEKLHNNLAGIKDMPGLPAALFVIDVGYEDIAVSEAVKLGIPVIGIVDSNNSPDGIDYVIPGNDDAIRAIRLYTGRMADAVLDARAETSHLGEGGDADEFVELDETGSPVTGTETVKTRSRTAKKTVAKKKTAAGSNQKIADEVKTAGAAMAAGDQVEDVPEKDGPDAGSDELAAAGGEQVAGNVPEVAGNPEQNVEEEAAKSTTRKKTTRKKIVKKKQTTAGTG